jgi:hypothetical protein
MNDFLKEAFAHLFRRALHYVCIGGDGDQEERENLGVQGQKERKLSEKSTACYRSQKFCAPPAAAL